MNFATTAQEWIKFALLFLGLFLFIGIAEKTRSALGWSPEVTRKLVHILTGILVFFTPFLFVSILPLLFLATIFIVINYLAIRLQSLKGMHGTTRITYGTVFYPIAFFLLVLLFWENYTIIIQVAILILAIPDALAAIVGENLAHPHGYQIGGESKSVEGSATFFLSAFVITIGVLQIVPSPLTKDINFSTICWIAFVVGLFATALEAISWAGSDNLTAPLGSAFILHFMLTHSAQQNLSLTIGILLALVVALGSFKLRFLDSGGAVVTFILGAVIFGIGGWIWGIPILTFFLSSSILSKLWRNRKKHSSFLFEKTSRRDMAQVLANGGVAGAVILIWYVSQNPIWYLVYLGTLAAVTADTWATEIGVLSKPYPWLITTFKRVVPGTSGGVSVIGIIGALLGAAIIALLGVLFYGDFFGSPLKTLIIVSLAGLLASLVDSFIGATLQAQYYCPVCQKLTEKRHHCNNTPTEFRRGHIWMNNDMVNSICAFSGSVFILLGVYLM